jgi:hypothetical protein
MPVGQWRYAFIARFFTTEDAAQKSQNLYPDIICSWSDSSTSY